MDSTSKQRWKVLGAAMETVTGLMELQNGRVDRTLSSYCRYISLWSATAPIHTIIIGQSPYSEYDVPYKASSFAHEWHGEPTASVHILANSVAQFGAVSYLDACRVFCESYQLLEHGIMCIDARVKAVYLTDEAQEEADEQISCIKEILVLASMTGMSRVTLICLGKEAKAMGRMLEDCVSRKRLALTVRIMGCAHPARISRHSAEEPPVLYSDAVSFELASLVRKTAPFITWPIAIVPEAPPIITEQHAEALYTSLTHDVDLVMVESPRVADRIDRLDKKIEDKRNLLKICHSYGLLERVIDLGILDSIEKNQVKRSAVLERFKMIIDRLCINMRQVTRFYSI